MWALITKLYLYGQNGPISQFLEIFVRKHYFGNKQQSITFSRTRVPHQFSIVALLSWIYAIKKIFVVLELGKLEYHLHSTRVYQARVPFFKKKKKKIYTVLEFTKLEYCVNFFFFFFKKKVLEPGRLEYCVNGT